ncbi:tail assembly chaperone [Xenorhabdus sp. TS4]|nr:tail fiber assembly protein [Xenorhabdus sp. TS4]MBC8949620.1 tail assembly chaperone [Xenorhabdus sp. TS4]
MMSKTYIYCANNEKYDPPCPGFWPVAEREHYPNTFPESGVEVDEAVKQRFDGQWPSGKRLGCDERGYPAWVDIPPPPPPSPAELRQQAEFQKQQLMFSAANSIAPLQDAVDLDMATDAEKLSLAEWRKYRVLLNRVDCSTAPDIQWPEQPK